MSHGWQRSIGVTVSADRTAAQRLSDSKRGWGTVVALSVTELEGLLDQAARDRESRPSTDPKSIPTGSVWLDCVLGAHGWPVGKTSRIYGEAAIGKSTLLYHGIAEAQRLGMSVALCDLQNSFSPAYAERIGIRLSELLLLPTSAAWGDAPVDVLAIDGVSSQLQANCLTYSKTILVAAQIANRVFSPHYATDLGTRVSPTVPAEAVAVRLTPGWKVPGGMAVCAEPTTDIYRPAAPDWDGGFEVVFNEGIDRAADVCGLALSQDIIESFGNWYLLPGGSKAQGYRNAVNLLRTQPEQLESLEAEVRKRLGHGYQ